MNTTLRVSGVLFVLLAAACSKPHSTFEQADAALDLISAEALKAHVEYLADDARMGREQIVEAGEVAIDGVLALKCRLAPVVVIADIVYCGWLF